MKSMGKYLVLGLGMALSGCMTLSEPKPMYSNASHPKSDTTIFAVDNMGHSVDGDSTRGFILAVDSVSTIHRAAGWDTPPWVRLLPGNHNFHVRYMIGHLETEKTVYIAQMKPRHVYVAHLRDLGGVFDIKVEDLGENSDFTVHVPFSAGDKSGDFKATF